MKKQTYVSHSKKEDIEKANLKWLAKDQSKKTQHSKNSNFGRCHWIKPELKKSNWNKDE